MKRLGLLLPLVFALALAWFGVRAPAPARAATLAQPTPFPTPTPREDGAIVYIVQPGDTLWRIAAISGVPIEELRALNGLRSDVVSPGQPLILGYAVPGATPTPATANQPTPTPLLPTPTPVPQLGVICAFLFQDSNGNAVFDDDEVYLTGGAVSLQSRAGLQRSGTTADEPLCFEDLPPGDYNLAMGIPEGLNPTTATNRPVRLEEGDTLYVAFGAQPAEENPGLLAGGGSPWLAIVGGVLVLAGAVLGWYAWRASRPPYLQQ